MAADHSVCAPGPADLARGKGAVPRELECLAPWLDREHAATACDLRALAHACHQPVQLARSEGVASSSLQAVLQPVPHRQRRKRAGDDDVAPH